MIKPDRPRERRDRGGGAPRGPQEPVLTNGLHTKISCGTTLVQHRARAGAGCPDSTRSRCLRCRFGQAHRRASGRTLHAGHQGRRPDTVAHKWLSADGPPSTSIHIPANRPQAESPRRRLHSTIAMQRPAPADVTSPSTLVASAGQVADRGHRQTTAHQREAVSCQPTIRTFSTRQVTTYARKAPNSVPAVPSRK